MNLLTSLSNFLIYLRLHKGRSRKTQEQYIFHLWRFTIYLIGNTHPELAKIRSEDILPPTSSNLMKNWKSPLLELSREIREPTIESIRKEDFDMWRLSLSDSGLSVKTVNAHMITIRSWLKYLKKEQIDCLDPTTIDLMKAPDREVTFLTQEEIERFFESIARETLIGKRDFAICECIYSTGLRISELTTLDRRDVNLETMEFAVRGK